MEFYELTNPISHHTCESTPVTQALSRATNKQICVLTQWETLQMLLIPDLSPSQLQTESHLLMYFPGHPKSQISIKVNIPQQDMIGIQYMKEVDHPNNNSNNIPLIVVTASTIYLVELFAAQDNCMRSHILSNYSLSSNTSSKLCNLSVLPSLSNNWLYVCGLMPSSNRIVINVYQIRFANNQQTPNTKLDLVSKSSQFILPPQCGYTLSISNNRMIHLIQFPKFVELGNPLQVIENPIEIQTHLDDCMGTQTENDKTTLHKHGPIKYQLVTLHSSFSVYEIRRVFGNFVIMYMPHIIQNRNSSETDLNPYNSILLVYDCNMKFTRNIITLTGIISSCRLIENSSNQQIKAIQIIAYPYLTDSQWYLSTIKFYEDQQSLHGNPIFTHTLPEKPLLCNPHHTQTGLLIGINKQEVVCRSVFSKMHLYCQMCEQLTQLDGSSAMIDQILGMFKCSDSVIPTGKKEVTGNWP